MRLIGCACSDATAADERSLDEQAGEAVKDATGTDLGSQAKSNVRIQTAQPTSRCAASRSC